MEAIALLGGLKLFIDIIEGGPRAVVKGVITSAVPFSDAITVADSVDYIFNLSGDYQGTINSSQYDEFYASEFEFVNQERLDFALSNFDFPSLAKKQLNKMNPRTFKDRDFPTF